MVVAGKARPFRVTLTAGRERARNVHHDFPLDDTHIDEQRSHGRCRRRARGVIRV